MVRNFLLVFLIYLQKQEPHSTALTQQKYYFFCIVYTQDPYVLSNQYHYYHRNMEGNVWIAFQTSADKRKTMSSLKPDWLKASQVYHFPLHQHFPNHWFPFPLYNWPFPFPISSAQSKGALVDVQQGTLALPCCFSFPVTSAPVDLCCCFSSISKCDL